MRLYHRTSRRAARQILAKGFRDGVGTYLTRNIYRGVWVSNVPLDENEGAFGDTLLVVDLKIPATKLGEYEWVEDGKTYREFLIPASVLNRARISVFT
jgi:hypothetical protein